MAHHKLPYFPFFPTDFLGDQRVQAMTVEEVGAYMLLLCMAWQEKPRGSLPDDQDLWARWARVSPERWFAMQKAILPCWQKLSDGRYYQLRMQAIWSRIDDIAMKRAAAGRKGAAARWATVKVNPVANSKKMASGIANGLQEHGIQMPDPNKNTLPSEAEGRESPAAFLAAWNSTPHVKPAKVLSAGRLKHLQARLRDPDWQAHYPAALAKIPLSRFLRGENDRGWVATMDWFLRPDSVTKVLEGVYDDHPRGSTGKPAPFSGIREWLENIQRESHG